MAGHKKPRSGWVCQHRKPIDSQASYLLRLQSMQDSFAAHEQKNVRNTVERFSSHKSLNKYRNAVAFDSLHENATMYNRGMTPPTWNKLSYRDLKRGKQMPHPPEDWYQIRSNLKSTQKEQKKIQRPLPALTEKEMARIISSMQVIRQYPEANYGMIPSRLPTIPSVGHKSILLQENRIRALLTEDIVSETPNIRKHESPKKASRHDRVISPKRIQRGPVRDIVRVPTLRGPAGLLFDVDPDDKEVFVHGETAVGPDEPSKVTSDTKEVKSENVLVVKVQSSNGYDQGLSLSGIPDVPPNSRPESLTPHIAPDLIKVPDLVIETDPPSSEDLREDCGELSRAMTKLNTSHCNLEKLKDEVNELGQLNKILEED